MYSYAAKRHTDFFVIFFQRNTGKKVGFTATKKIGNAVQRNRAKRVLRALFVHVCDELCDGTYIFVAKEGVGMHPHKELLMLMKKNLSKLQAL